MNVLLMSGNDEAQGNGKRQRFADLSAQTRVSFAPGKSSTVISGVLGKRGAKDSIKKFVVRAAS